MAHSVTGASLDGIYTQLNGASEYHPLDAQTFADWSVEAGDVVKFRRGNTDYDSPVHNTKVVWRGSPQVTISSAGTKEREPVSRVSRKKYGRGGNAVRANEGINSYVSNMEGNIYTYIEQTASYIMDHVGARTGAKVYTGIDEPVEDPENPFVDGDLWIEGSLLNTWDDMEDIPWEDSDPEAHEYDWLQLSGQVFHVWKDGKWAEAADGTKFAEYTDFVRTKDRVMSVARNVERVDGEIRSNIARLDVRADIISSSVRQNSNSIGEIGSRITQTAAQIRSEVHAANSQLYSAIEETATSIRSYVVDEINDIGSEILQTASQIRSEVHAANSTIYSFIDQTATYIRQEVANTESSLRSSITTEANRISLVVEGTGANAKIKPAAIVASINDGASSIVISANHINLDGYVKATDITADLITTKLALASNVNAKKLTLTNNGYIVLPSGDGSISITGSNASDIIRGLKVVSSGNGYKLQAITYGDSSWHDLPNSSFSRAVSSWVWGGGDGKINVTALPQNQTRPINVSIDGQNTITSNGTYTYTVDYENADGDDVSTGATKTVTVNVGGSHSISITPDNVGHSSEPTGTELWSSTTLQRDKWYKFTVYCGSASKVYKIYID